MATSVVGFDIGNLGSKIGVARNRGIDVIVNEVSNRSTPSLVGFGPRTRAIGEPAKTAETSNFRNTVGSLKRLVGRAFGDPDIEQYEAKYINAELVNVHGQVGVRVNYLGEDTVFTAAQVYAMLLGKLRDTTANEIKAPVNDVVIAIPGWYTDRQRRAVKDAAEIAGLRALQLVNDTTATAFGYGITKSDLPEGGDDVKPRIVAFVDIGHSDYSVAIAAFKKGKVDIKGTAYDANFGGRDLDYALCVHFAEEFKSKYKIDVLSNKKALFRLTTAVEKLKKILSANAQAPLSVESIMNDVDASSSLSREDFEQLVAPLLERTTKPLEEALAAACLQKEDIDVIELVGGSTRVPALKNRIQAFFGKSLSVTTNQDEAIARGTTFLCASVSPVFRVRDFAIQDVQSRPIEISWEQEDGTVQQPLLAYPAGSPYPSTKSLSVWRSSDFAVEVQYSPNGAWIARATIKGVKPDAKGESQLTKVKVGLNASGIFEIKSAQIIEESGEEEPAAAAAPAPQGEATMETEAAPPAKKPRKTSRRDLVVVAGTSSLDQSLVNEMREKEGQMHSGDKLVKETEDRKNALEEYIYEARDKIEGSWSAFGAADVKSALRSASEEAENWLYSDEGEDATKSAYTSKLDELKKLGDPMAFRYREHDERPKAQRELNETLATLMASATSGDEKTSHLSEEELQRVIEKVATTQKWLDDQSFRQSERTKDQDAALTSAEIKKRQEEVLLFCTPILSRPKPKPKTEAPPQTNTEQPKKDEQAPPPPTKDDAPMTENEGDLADAEGAEAPAGNAEQTNKPDGMDID